MVYSSCIDLCVVFVNETDNVFILHLCMILLKCD